jgi:hypothetical protein
MKKYNVKELPNSSELPIINLLFPLPVIEMEMKKKCCKKYKKGKKHCKKCPKLN